MADEYLWDRSGETDPEVRRLETLLAPYRYRERLRRSTSWSKIAIPLAIAATLVIGAVAMRLWRDPASGWTLNGKSVSSGQTITTGYRDRITLLSASVGEVTLDRNSEIRVLPSHPDKHQIALTKGTLHAVIWAPPAQFAVDMPSARSIDLGCAYTLTARPDGTGLLVVSMGWVAFQSGSVESFIPAGASCATTVKSGPGLPCFEDASPALRKAVEDFDATGSESAVRKVVDASRPRDALTLWHLIGRTSGPERALAATRFGLLVPQVDSAGLIRGDAGAMDRAWNALGLGRTDWWRTWKASWSAPEK